MRRKEEMPKLEDEFKDWTKNIDKLLKETPANYPNRSVISEKVRASLREVADLKTSYEEFVKKEIVKRDYSVGKKEAASEIVLDKFSGEEAGQKWVERRLILEEAIQFHQQFLIFSQSVINLAHI